MKFEKATKNQDLILNSKRFGLHIDVMRLCALTLKLTLAMDIIQA